MSCSSAPLAVVVDTAAAATLMANMLEAWLQQQTPSPPVVEGGSDECEADRAASAQSGVRLCASIDDGTGALHQESTERQYALREKALELGWIGEAIRILDGIWAVWRAEPRPQGLPDPGGGGLHGRVGAVLALEVSRLARSNLDWHRLLELCALTGHLVIDEDGCYDPADFNDGLLLGLKGTMAQAELHFLRARLQGGKRNKAAKGELHFPLPVGLCYDAEGHTVLDPDAEVRGAVQLVFVFRENGSAYAVVQRFAAGAALPQARLWRRLGRQAGVGRLSHERVLGMLRNPAYAGAYVFGRYQSADRRADGQIQGRSPRGPDQVVARQPSRPPRGLYRVGGVLAQSGKAAAQSHQHRGDAFERRGA